MAGLPVLECYGVTEAEDFYPDANQEWFDHQAELEAARFAKTGKAGQGSHVRYYDGAVRLNVVPGDSVDDKVVWMCTTLSRLAVRWIFQHERGFKTGIDHFQLRVEMKPIRPSTFYNRLQVDYPEEAAAAAAEELRLSTYSGFAKALDTHKNAVQEQLNAIVDNPDIIDEAVRKIWVVWCPGGGSGKSSFVEWCGMTRRATVVKSKDPADLQRHLMVAYEKGELRPWIFVDLPREIPDDFISQTLLSLEGIKSGLLCEDRHYSRLQRIGFIHHIMVFMNDPIPEWSRLTPDRWACVSIETEGDLSDMTLEQRNLRREQAKVKFVSMKEMQEVQDEQTRYIRRKRAFKRKREAEELADDRRLFKSGMDDKKMRPFVMKKAK